MMISTNNELSFSFKINTVLDKFRKRFDHKMAESKPLKIKDYCVYIS